jgi:paraquat-inducible protein B
VQQNLQDTLLELQRTARALRVLADYLQQHPESILRGKPADKPVPVPPQR